MIYRAALFGLAACFVNSASFAMASDAKTRGIMDAVYAPMAEVFPLSLSDDDFTAKTNRNKILTALDQLAENASRLQSHAKGKDKAFDFVAKSLASDAKDVARWYRRGWYNEARFTLHNMTENCISCHSRIKGDKDFPGSEGFVKDTQLAKLPPLERANLLVVTRQFEKAMSLYESVFRDPKSDASLLVSLDAFTDYLKVAIRVKGNLKRPKKLMDELAARKSTPVHVKLLLSNWSQTLTKFDQKNWQRANTLSAGEGTIKMGRAVMEFPRDREGLIHFVVASGILSNYLDTNPRAERDLGKAYYLLGVTESLLERSFWLSQQEFYLATAIRTAPGQPFATKAYALLEEQTIIGYTGSGGTMIPADVQELLDELKNLIEQSKGA